MNVIIAGSRSIKDEYIVYDAIQEFCLNRDIHEVICGMAEGVDLIGKKWADLAHIKVAEFPVLPSERWKGGPCQRNQRMADYAKSTGMGALLLVWDGVSSGSLDMLKRARKAELYIMIVDLSQPRLF